MRLILVCHGHPNYQEDCLTQLDFTAITVLHFLHEEGTLVCPKIELMNDARHIDGLESPEFFGN